MSDKKEPQIPYVGITGVTCDRDVGTIERCAALLRRQLPSHRLMAGVLVSRKTMLGMVPGNPARYPPIGRVGAMLRRLCNAGAWPVVHYNTSSAEAAHQQSELEEILDLGPVTAIQLNLQHPHLLALRSVSASRGAAFILQVRQPNADAAETQANAFREVCDWALLDPSGGRGNSVDTGQVDALTAIERTGVGVGVAGGLDGNAESVLRVKNYQRALATALSVDAESRLRDTNDALDGGLAVAYTSAMADALRSD